MSSQLTCMVTIHGIGFQQAPQDGQPGYADGLHAHLQEHLPQELGSDPLAEFGRPAGTGAIYVHSDWPPATRNVNEGLARLGRWKAGDASHRELEALDAAPLAEGERPIAHVALVYSHLEDQGTHTGAALETFAKAVISHGRYAALPSLIAAGVSDAWAAVMHRPGAGAPPAAGLQVRAQPGTAGQGTSGLLDVIHQLDRDVSTYVCRNDLRERVRSFVHDALLRLCCRPDVGGVVVNAHSQGTVLAYDTLRTLPPFAAERVKLLVTAGSPLRKYATLFYWGTDAACISQMPWRNYWDKNDPVADPLAPPLEWHRDDPLPAPTGRTALFEAIDPDTGRPLAVSMLDRETQNAEHGGGGGLPAHNYWDNDAQFVQPLARLLRAVATGSAVTEED